MLCLKNLNVLFMGDMSAAAARSPQLCPTLRHPRDSSPPGSPVHGILQARTLEWVAISFSNAWKWKVKVKALRRVRPTLATPWTAAHQGPPSMGFSRQEYWSGVPLPSPRMSGTSYFEKVQGMFVGSQVSGTHPKNQPPAMLYFCPRGRTKCLQWGQEVWAPSEVLKPYCDSNPQSFNWDHTPGIRN